jgi:hypothetical protein
VKQTSADGSVASAHVRVGHRQTPKYQKTPARNGRGFLLGERKVSFVKIYDVAHSDIV